MTGLLAAVDGRTYIRLHTLQPDAEEVHNWIPKVTAWQKDKLALWKRYSQAYGAPDPEMTLRYVTKERFYDRNDPILRLAAALRRGDAESTIDLEQAHEAAATQSLFAQTLARGLGNLRTAADFFERRTDDKAFRARIEIS